MFRYILLLCSRQSSIFCPVFIMIILTSCMYIVQVENIYQIIKHHDELIDDAHKRAQTNCLILQFNVI